MKKGIGAFLYILTMIAWSISSHAQQANLEHKIVIQLNTADTSAWSSTIGHIKNIQKIWPSHLQIEVVVHGKALDFLIKDKTYFANDITILTKQGIVFSACENTMRKHHVEKSALLSEAFTVPSGVVEVVLKQEQGWSYLKAGSN